MYLKVELCETDNNGILSFSALVLLTGEMNGIWNVKTHSIYAQASLP